MTRGGVERASWFRRSEMDETSTAGGSGGGGGCGGGEGFGDGGGRGDEGGKGGGGAVVDTEGAAVMAVTETELSIPPALVSALVRLVASARIPDERVEAVVVAVPAGTAMLNVMSTEPEAMKTATAEASTPAAAAMTAAMSAVSTGV